MSDNTAEKLGLTRDEARRIVDYLSETAFAESDMSYGFFHGGDPRDFSPDVECSTEEERAQHKADCERWSSGAPQEPEPGPHAPIVNSKDEVVGHVTLCGYGMGTNTYKPEPKNVELMNRLTAFATGGDE